MPPVDPERLDPAVIALGWTDTERLTRRLADRLRTRLGQELSETLFLPVPRGGLFVLGLLAYLLDLDRRQLGALARTPEASCVVLVDDCALSGARLAQAIERTQALDPDSRIVVAHLCSHPALRRAVEAEEPRVDACVAAADLAARDDLPQAALDGFEERWRDRLPGRRYWLGPVEPVAFPWSEPESVWWHARDGRLEEGWHRVAPWKGLRFRAELGLPPEAAEDERRPPGALDLAPDVVWKLDRQGGGRLVMRGADDHVYGFEETALEIWRALLGEGTREAAARRLSLLYEVGEAEARRDVDELVDELLSRGLLVSRSDVSGGEPAG